METKDQAAARRATQGLRRPPVEPNRVHVGLDSRGKLGERIVPGPIELTVEATDVDGETVSWLDDAFWTRAMQRWADESVTVHIAPTPHALLHVVVLHQMEMLRRVVPGWRLVGHAYRDDVAGDTNIELAATSAYDEIRFHDEPRPGHAGDVRRWELPLDKLFGQIRREQARAGVTRPILMRLSAGHAASRLTAPQQAESAPTKIPSAPV